MTYQIRTAAHNIHGWGLYSEELVEVSTNVPEQALPIVSELDNLSVKISWSAPADNYREITSYVVKIANHDASSLSSDSNCDASIEAITQ
jgi:hypothetical protein